MSLVKWIHFSDLHLNSVGVESVILRDSLPPYLRQQNITCDYAFCTGDIRYAPGGAFPSDASQKIAEICESVNVPVDKFFVVPGNHDVSREFPGRDESVRNVYFRHDHDSSGYYKPGDGIIHDDDLESISKGKTNFIEFVEHLYHGNSDRIECYKNYMKPHFAITTEHINVLHVDSTLSYTKYQERNLILGTQLLQKAMEQLDRNKPTILLTHYSFDYLSRDEQRILCLLINQSNTKLWLAGHEHNHLARVQYDSFYEFQCGNLVLEDGARSCVIIGELDTETGRGNIQVHAWYPTSGWARYPFVCQVGEDRSVYFFNIRGPISTGIENRDRGAMRQDLRESIQRLLSENRSVFNTYGPTEKNMNAVRSEHASIWEEMIGSTILPNNQKIVDLLEENLNLLTEEEMDICRRFKIHAEGFARNHSGHGYIMDSERFPVEINDILTD